MKTDKPSIKKNEFPKTQTARLMFSAYLFSNMDLVFSDKNGIAERKV